MINPPRQIDEGDLSFCSFNDCFAYVVNQLEIDTYIDSDKKYHKSRISKMIYYKSISYGR